MTCHHWAAAPMHKRLLPMPHREAGSGVLYMDVSRGLEPAVAGALGLVPVYDSLLLTLRKWVLNQLKGTSSSASSSGKSTSSLSLIGCAYRAEDW